MGMCYSCLFMSYTPESAVRNQLTICTQAPLGLEVVSLAEQTALPLQDSGVQEGLNQVRDQLTLLQQSEHPDDKAAWKHMQAAFSADATLYMPEKLWTDKWQDDAPGQIIVSPDSILLELLSWNVMRQREHQRRLEEDLPRLQEEAVTAFDRISDFGLLPFQARALAREAVTKSSFLALDSFEEGKMMSDAYYHIPQRILAMSNYYTGGPLGLDQSLPGMQKTFNHEVGHGVDAECNGGLQQILPSENIDSIPFVFFNEFFVEHIAQVADHGRPMQIAPANRPSDNSSGPVERTLGQLILYGGERCIEPGLLGEAYIESLTGDNTPARTKLDRELYNSFKNVLDLPATHIVATIAQECWQVPIVEMDGVMSRWIEALCQATGYKWHIPKLPTRPTENS